MVIAETVPADAYAPENAAMGLPAWAGSYAETLHRQWGSGLDVFSEAELKATRPGRTALRAWRAQDDSTYAAHEAAEKAAFRAANP